jgi:hypothetical protein
VVNSKASGVVSGAPGSVAVVTLNVAEIPPMATATEVVVL